MEGILTIYQKKDWEKKIVPHPGPSDIAQELGLEGIASHVRLIMSYDLQKKPLPKMIRKSVPIINQPDLNIIVGERIFPFSTDIERNLRTQFSLVLSNFELALIQRCQRKDCEGYFLKGTKKDKRYCSKRCYFTEAQRERRERMKKVQKRKIKRIGRREE